MGTSNAYTWWQIPLESHRASLHNDLSKKVLPLRWSILWWQLSIQMYQLPPRMTCYPSPSIFYDDNNTIVKGGYTFSQLCQVMDSSELLVRDCDDIACECSCYTVFPFLSFDILVYCHTLNIHNVLIFFYAGINQGMVISISLPTWINYWCIVSCLGIRNENLELQHYFSILMG